MTNMLHDTTVDECLLIDECLQEMFKRVGMTFPDPEFTKDEEWYNRKTWTAKERNNFSSWMKKFYMERRPEASQKLVDVKVTLFLSIWGWKVSRKAKKCQSKS